MVGHPGIIKEFSELFPNKKMLDPYIEACLSGDDVCNKVEPQEYSNGEDSSDSQNVSRDQSSGSVNCFSCLMNHQSCSEIHLVSNFKQQRYLKEFSKCPQIFFLVFFVILLSN